MTSSFVLLQEMSETVEKLSVQLEGFKEYHIRAGKRSDDNADKIETISVSLDVIKAAIEEYQPYMEE
jgi:hypothetical protein